MIGFVSHSETLQFSRNIAFLSFIDFHLLSFAGTLQVKSPLGSTSKNAFLPVTSKALKVALSATIGLFLTTMSFQPLLCAEGSVHLFTLDPGHFHAALVQK